MKTDMKKLLEELEEELTRINTEIEENKKEKQHEITAYFTIFLKGAKTQTEDIIKMIKKTYL